jgi:putative hemolysin
MNIAATSSPFSLSLAQTDDDLMAVQRLRYDVFVAECGAAYGGIDHVNRLEIDRFDACADHLLLRDVDLPQNSQVIGAYRLIRSDHADAATGFYSAGEFDLSPLTGSGRKLLELGRSCLHPEYRRGTALLHLWQGLSAYVVDHEIDDLFGVASFAGTDLIKHQHALRLLHNEYLAPRYKRPQAIGANAVPLTGLPSDNLNRRTAMIAMPALIKAYLRMGGVVGAGAYVDHGFGTTDVCMILDATQLSARQRAYLGDF